MRVTYGTSLGGKEGRRQTYKNNAYEPIYLLDITVDKSFTAVRSSWDSSSWPANGIAGPTGRQGTAGSVLGPGHPKIININSTRGANISMRTRPTRHRPYSKRDIFYPCFYDATYAYAHR